ncbi:hypothetical protein ACVWZ4_001215 [Bradyrhizobium sp. USDA 4472]
MPLVKDLGFATFGCPIFFEALKTLGTFFIFYLSSLILPLP